MKIIRRILIVFAAVILFAGCASSPPREFTTTSSPREPRRDDRVAGRDCLSPDQVPHSRSGAHAYLVFTSRPGSKDKERYRRYEVVCEAFRNSFEPVSAFPDDGITSPVPTYWLVRSSSVCSQPDPDCGTLIDGYDFARAARIASAVGKQSASGPLLVAMSNPSGLVEKEEALVFDLSNFADEDIERAFQIWRGRITRDPSKWKDGFRVIVFQQTVRNLLQKYGESILAVVHPKEK